MGCGPSDLNLMLQLEQVLDIHTMMTGIFAGTVMGQRNGGPTVVVERLQP